MMWLRKELAGFDRTLVAIVALSLLAKLVLLTVILLRLGEPGLITIVDDGTTYLHIAENLLAHRGYSMATLAPYLPDAIRVPVIPVLMAISLAAFNSLIPVALVGILLSAIQPVIVWKLAERFKLPRWAVVLATALSALEPSVVMLNSLAISEPLFVTFLLAGILFAVKAKEEPSYTNALLAALLLVLAAYTRPIGLYVIPVVFVWYLVARPRAWKYVLAMLVLTGLLVSPWLIRNHERFGVYSFSSGGIQNVYTDFGASIRAFTEGTSSSAANFEQFNEAARISGLSYEEVEAQDLRLNKFLVPATIELIKSHPVDAVKAFAYSEFAFFTNDSYRFYYLNRLAGLSYDGSFDPTLSLFRDPVHTLPKLFALQSREFFFSLIGRLFFLATSVLGTLGLLGLFIKRETRCLAILLILILGYFAAASATGGYGVTVRYRFPVQSLLYLGTAAFLAFTWAWYDRRHTAKPLASMQSRKLNFGSGQFAKEGFVNLDFRPDIGADVVHDLNSGPLPFPDNSFDHVEGDHVLEHVDRPFHVLKDLHRVCASGATIDIRVPHFSRGFSHPEHAHGFDVSLPLYFDPSFKGGYEGVEFKLREMRLTWFAQRYLKKITLSGFQYVIGVFLSSIFDFFAALSPYACSRLWCFWVGGFEEIHYVFEVVKDSSDGTA